MSKSKTSNGKRDSGTGEVVEKRYPLPECHVQPGTSAHIFTSLPGLLIPFQPTGFEIPMEAARRLVITDIKVGQHSQLVSTGCVPASLFVGPSMWLPRLRLDRMESSLVLTLSVTNVSDETARFSGVVIGHHGGGSQQIVEEEDRISLYLCGLGHNLVPAGQRFILSVQPQVEMRPRRLFVPVSQLQYFDVESVVTRPYQHGYKNDSGVFGADGPHVSEVIDRSLLEAANPRGSGSIWLAPGRAISPSTFLVLRIRNRSKKPQWFGGAVLG